MDTPGSVSYKKGRDLQIETAAAQGGGCRRSNIYQGRVTVPGIGSAHSHGMSEWESFVVRKNSN